MFGVFTLTKLNTGKNSARSAGTLQRRTALPPVVPYRNQIGPLSPTMHRSPVVSASGFVLTGIEDARCHHCAERCARGASEESSDCTAVAMLAPVRQLAANIAVVSKRAICPEPQVLLLVICVPPFSKHYEVDHGRDHSACPCAGGAASSGRTRCLNATAVNTGKPPCLLGKRAPQCNTANTPKRSQH